ncbi:PTS fructose transporter subunit IIA [Sphaerotilus montanus]|jgi:PTS system ascorbate-specific IIA component|uniref:PTS system ascorbate-specific IIA component n=1 Tax=Sphaerotilus montanus TaxID=522889 RepID=A0A7Y9QXR4_9BURK|nr:PTS fructose transporter subunit IIA [Sphaerotilus montanus]MBP8272111.1 PTS fructose transporter subunit IIA [Sphaerotilus sp.]NYG33408.1 PTS system ascorbate-specific IIA component [Sphaerotilus montanus]NZD56958.1 PTS fructose transporter subunit IIA [Sphaerotilus montanus]
MARLLIIAHAPLASALKAVAAHTFPEEADKLRVLDVLPDMPGEEIESLARALLPAEDDVSDPEALVLCDVFGATPANVVQRLVDGVRIRAIAGVNVSMLWRTLSSPLHATVGELFDRAMKGGVQGVLPVASTRPQNQAFPPGGHDPNQHHHQQ